MEGIKLLEFSVLHLLNQYSCYIHLSWLLLLIINVKKTLTETGRCSQSQGLWQTHNAKNCCSVDIHSYHLGGDRAVSFYHSQIDRFSSSKYISWECSLFSAMALPIVNTQATYWVFLIMSKCIFFFFFAPFTFFFIFFSSTLFSVEITSSAMKQQPRYLNRNSS